MAVLAIDPSSPFSGGAILGDRVRMSDHATDDGVFIRSMATRGHLGGLSLATLEAVRVLDAAGWPWIVIETVGVGQVEVEVAGAADTTVVVVNPGWGDAVQANKAGLLEIADVFVINKADRPGADETRRDLERMLDLTAPDGWRPPVVATTAATGEGAPELWAAIGEHRQHLTTTGSLEPRRAARVQEELVHIVAALLHERALAAGGQRPRGPVGRGGGPARRPLVGCRGSCWTRGSVPRHAGPRTPRPARRRRGRGAPGQPQGQRAVEGGAAGAHRGGREPARRPARRGGGHRRRPHLRGRRGDLRVPLRRGARPR